jgi:ribonucleoside-diphosphate reductase alpha chain
VDGDQESFDFDTLEQIVPKAVRFLDNVNDLTYVPLEEQRRNLNQKRRIGLGHYGDGSALAMMKTRYGSEEGARKMRELQERLANLAYQASAQLAKEKEPFPLFDRDYYLNEAPVVQRLSDKTREMIAAHGLRNSHLLSIQPTGNTSTLANAPSSGIEPVFMHSYIRTSEQPSLPDDIADPRPVDWENLTGGDMVLVDGTDWEAEEQGDEAILRCLNDGYTEWQVHPTRGIVRDSLVEDYAKRNMGDEFDPDADWAVTTRDLDVDDHLAQMKAIAPFVDSAMSKTVNVPQDYPFEDFKDLYLNAHQTGVIKGLTTYRAGTMSAVLSADEDEGGIQKTEAPDRPEDVECAIHNVRYAGDYWRVLVGFLDDDPYEVFAFQTDQKVQLVDESGRSLKEGIIRKHGSGHYQLVRPSDEEVLVDDVTEWAPSDEVRIETRLISTALRHGADLKFIVGQLKKAEGSIASFGNSVAKALQAHVDEIALTCDSCGSDNVRMVEGCMTCADCGHSKCS